MWHISSGAGPLRPDRSTSWSRWRRARAGVEHRGRGGRPDSHRQLRDAAIPSRLPQRRQQRLPRIVVETDVRLVGQQSQRSRIRHVGRSSQRRRTRRPRLNRTFASMGIARKGFPALPGGRGKKRAFRPALVGRLRFGTSPTAKPSPAEPVASGTRALRGRRAATAIAPIASIAVSTCRALPSDLSRSHR